MIDEFSKAVTATIFPALKPMGFRRHGKRDLIRVDGRIVQRLYFQLSGWGGRDFRTTCCANLIPGNEYATLQPGHELGKGKWLPSLTAEQAKSSATVVFGWIVEEALPFFEEVRTLPGFAKCVAKADWGASHHGKFQQGMAMALDGKDDRAITLLEGAEAIYYEDGCDWAVQCAIKTRFLIDALKNGTANDLLEKWTLENRKVHGA